MKAQLTGGPAARPELQAAPPAAQATPAADEWPAASTEGNQA